MTRLLLPAVAVIFAAILLFVSAGDSAFDLDDPANDLELFQLRVELPYSEIRPLIIWGGENLVLTSALTFRNARAEMVQ